MGALSLRLRVGRLPALGLAGILAACGYAPLPSNDAGGGGTAATEASVSGVDATSLNGLDGKVCCVAAGSEAPKVINGIATTYNGWDTAFISWMVPHYAVAAQLAELAPTRAGSEKVKALAGAIDAEQGTMYLKMSAMALAWGQPVPSTDPAAAAGHDHGGGDSSGADNAAALGKLSGSAFDRKILAVLIADDKAALPIAKATIANGTNAQAKELAKEISAGATAQIGEMQKLLEELS